MSPGLRFTGALLSALTLGLSFLTFSPTSTQHAALNDGKRQPRHRRPQSFAPAVVAAPAAYPLTIDPVIQQARLQASDAAAFDFFGSAIAVSGDTAVVGAKGDDGSGGVNAGSAYVFVRSGGTWTQQARLQASDTAPGDLFGYSVAIDGDTVVVGAAGDDNSGGDNAGSAYVFVRSGAVWSEQARLQASGAAAVDNFGYSVALDGNTAIIGAFEDDNSGGADAGSAYIFTRSGAVWTQQARLQASDAAAGDNFGVSVEVKGDTAIVGATGDNNSGGTDAGSAYVFTRSGATWVEQQRLQASDAAVGDNFGVSVALDGDTIVTGAYLDDNGGGNDAGSAYVFVRSGATWTEQAKLQTSDAAAGDVVGFSVDLQGNTAVVNAIGDDNSGGANAGSVYVFTRSGTVWVEQQRLQASDAAAGDLLGYVVALDGDTVVAGAIEDDNSGGTDAGSAYVFLLEAANSAPVADAGADQTVECAGALTPVSLDGTASSDPDGDALTYSWSGGATQLGAGATLTTALTPGVHTITLTVTDPDGASDQDTVLINIVDTTPPAISGVSATPDSLWPPDHKMRDVGLSYTVADACCAVSASLSATSNEPDEWLGDGDTANDIEIVDAHHVRLRAERSGVGAGRAYTITITATDCANNTSSKAVMVRVPKSQRSR